MTTSANTWKHHYLQALQERVQPMLDGVDLSSQMTEQVESAIASGELGGGKATDDFKKLMILRVRGDISSEELEQLILADYS